MCVRCACVVHVVRVCYVLCAAASLVCCRLTGEKKDISVVVEHGVRTRSPGRPQVSTMTGDRARLVLLLLLLLLV